MARSPKKAKAVPGYILDIPPSSIVVLRDQQTDVLRVAEFLARLRAEPEYYHTPVRVRPIAGGYYQIRDGHHRFLSYLLNGNPLVRCFVDTSRDE